MSRTFFFFRPFYLAEGLVGAVLLIFTGQLPGMCHLYTGGSNIFLFYNFFAERTGDMFRRNETTIECAKQYNTKYIDNAVTGSESRVFEIDKEF